MPAVTSSLEGELDAWLKRDPIALYGSQLLADGGVTSAELAELDERVIAAVNDAIEQAKASSEAELSEMFNHVTASEGPGKNL